MSTSDPSTSSSAANNMVSQVPPCCWIVPAFRGVEYHTWYPTVVTQYTATVITTIVKSGSRLQATNSTTIMMPQQEVYTAFGAWGGGNQHAVLQEGVKVIPSASVPGVPTTLLPQVIEDSYGLTVVARANESAYIRAGGAATILSPTPFALWEMALTTSPAPAHAVTYDPAVCYTLATIPVITYAGDSVVSGFKTLSWPTDAGPALPLVWGLLIDAQEFNTYYTMASNIPNYDLTLDVPTPVSSAMVNDPQIRSSYPWISNCFVLPGEGQPTVHIAVTQLTTNSVVTIDLAEATTISPAAVLTSIGPAATSTSSTYVLPAGISTFSALAASTFLDHTPSSSAAADSSKTASLPSSMTAAQTSAAIVASAGTTYTSDDTMITLAGQPVTLITSSGHLAAVIGSTTLTAGGPAITENGAVFSLVTTASQLAAVVGGTTTVLLAPNSPTQVITLGTASGTYAYTVYPASGGGLAIGSTTLSPGSAAVIDGDTLSVSGTNLVVASGTQTSVQGLGPAVLSGLGGGSSATNAVSSRPVQQTGNASARSTCRMSAILAVLALMVLSQYIP